MFNANQVEQILSNPQTQQEFQDFADRYQQGDPTQGYSSQEAVQKFQQVAPQLPANDFQQAATQALQQLSPQQRQQLVQHISQQAEQQNVNLPTTGPATQGGGQSLPTDAAGLAQVLTQLHQQQPGVLPQLMSIESNPVAKAAIAGIAAMAAQRIMSRR